MARLIKICLTRVTKMEFAVAPFRDPEDLWRELTKVEEKAGSQSQTQRWPRGQRGEVWQLTVTEPIPTQAPWERVSLLIGRPRSSPMTWPQTEADTERIVSHSAVM